jgi:threonine dehydratase
MAVTDEAMLAGVRTLLESGHVLVEPAGAAALAGAWERREDLRGRRVVLILSGANITTPLLRRALDSEPLVPGPEG